MAFAELASALSPGSVPFQRAAEGIRALMVARTVRAFADQKRAGVAWPPRKVPNIAGIITDLRRSSRYPPARRFEPRPAGLDTGTLRASVAATSYVRGDVITYGSNQPHASKVQRGGTSALEIDDTVRKNLSKLLKNTPALRKSLGFLFNLKVFTVRTPARPFVALTDEDRAAVGRILQRELASVLKSGTAAPQNAPGGTP